MLFHSKYERARKWQIEEKNKREAMNGSKDMRDEVELADLLEKGDLFALISSAMFTILPVAFLALLLIVLVGMLFMRIL